MSSLRPCLLALFFAVGCQQENAWDQPRNPPDFRAVNAPIPQAYCTAIVEGKGARDTETDYIPRVIACENGGANLEALKAQAIAARSVLYYNMATSGSICDSQGCQVYTCNSQPKAIHYQAAAETSGQYLSFDGLLTYGFYVDGDHSPDPGTCKGSPQGANEKYVTYNGGKTGDQVKQTPLGYIGPPGFGQNRGCMAQWGARCLENNKGEGHADILRFYYGDDIKILTAPGTCTGCEPGCDGSKIIDPNCNEGDCAAYGANCVDDELGPRCVFFACPPQGTSKVCVDDDIIGTCVDGQITTGDCSIYAAYCSTKVGDEARCVSHFCASPQELPVPHDGCFLDGHPYHCDEVGQITADPCPDGQKCSVYPEVHCEADLGCPAEGEGSVCLSDTILGLCFAGGVPNTTDCGVMDAYCVEVDGTPACVSQVCLDSADDLPSDHDVCLPDGSVGHCFADGTLSLTDCPPGLICVDADDGAYCDEPEGTGTGVTESDSGSTQSGTGSDSSSDSSSDSAATSSEDSAGTGGSDSDSSAGGTAGDDTTDEGCGCRSAPQDPGAPLLFLPLLALLRRRRPSTPRRIDA